MYKTNNGGISWLPAQNGFTDGRILQIIIDPENPDTIYTSTGYTGVFKTENGGEIWRWLDTESGDPRWDAFYLFMNPSNPAHLVCTNSFTISESSDHGDSWERIEAPFDGPTLVAIDPKSGNLIAVDGNFDSETVKIYLSNGQRTEWELTYELEPTYNVLLNFLVYDQVRDKFLLSNNPDSVESNDGGQTWKEGSTASEFLDISADGLYYSGHGGFHGITIEEKGKAARKYRISNTRLMGHVIAVSQSNSDKIVVGGEGLWVTDDGGSSWKNRTNGIGTVRTLIGFDPNQKSIYLGQHIIRNTNLENTNNIQYFFSYNLDEKEYRDIIKSPCGSYPTQPWELAICGESIPPWEFDYFYKIINSPPRSLIRDPQNYDIRYLASDSGAYLSKDDGQTWDVINEGFLDMRIVYSLAFDPENGDLYAMTPYGIYKLEEK